MAYTASVIAAWLASPTPSPQVIRQVASELALSIIGGPNLAQVFEIFDQFGNPIFTVPTAGGPAVLGDNFSVFRPGDVFNPDFQVLEQVGNNISTNASGIQYGHGTGKQNWYYGIGAPSAVYPVTSGIPANGSMYTRLDGTAGATMYQVRAAAWVATAV